MRDIYRATENEYIIIIIIEPKVFVYRYKAPRCRLMSKSINSWMSADENESVLNAGKLSEK